MSQDSVRIDWLDNSADEDGFRIYRGTSLVGSVGAGVQAYLDTGLQQGTTYQYAVKAYNQAGESPAAVGSARTLAPPSAPTSLASGAVSQTSIRLQWSDNSGNEEGFIVFRNGTLVGSVAANATLFNDTGLQPATSYQYDVKSYNQVGESSAATSTFRTLNPPITIRLDRIGVHDNRESFLRGLGDVYVLVGIVDGDNTVTLKLPAGEGVTYSLDKEEWVDVGTIIYSTDSVGDNLTIAFQGYESDGGNFEQLAYQALGTAAGNYVPGGPALLQLVGIDLSSIIGSLLGEEDDWLGDYELTSGANNSWGIGQYVDVTLRDERGVECLRLWFTIASP